jgi:RNA polymerase sigma-70 factor (ECF subfamily)
MEAATEIGTTILGAVRSGDRKLQGEALQKLEPWLRLLARLHMETRFQGKFDPSDIVQETLLEAYRSLPRFRGSTPGELIAWLRKIHAHVLANEVKRHLARKRAIGKEVPLEGDLRETSRMVCRIAGTTSGSPSKLAENAERDLSLALALERLPEDYREVIMLRNMRSLSHEEVAERMGRSPGAVRMLWVRALEELRKILDQPQDLGPAPQS